MLRAISLKETNEFVKLLLDPANNRLVAPKNHTVSFKNNSWGCVSTNSAMKKMRLDSVADISHVLFTPDPSQPNNQVAVPVLAIVDGLRNNADVLMPEDLFFALYIS